jgi:hypothetical protein
MRFSRAMAAMARNQIHAAQFAEKMGWDIPRAVATLDAYGTGQYFPSRDELFAMGASDSLQWAYLVALTSYNAFAQIDRQNALQAATAIASKSTLEKWRQGNALPSGRKRASLEALFGVSLMDILPESVFVYVPSNTKVKLDLNRNRLWVSDFTVKLEQVSHDKYVVPYEALQTGFVEAAKEAGLIFIDHGDFMRAEPAPEVIIYYAKS